MELTNYHSTLNNKWHGRIDDLNNRDAFRIHQVINLIDLNRLDNLKINNSKLNICLLGFCSDEGVKRNMGREGAANGPKYIRKELANLPVSFSEDTILYDAGDVYCVNDNLEEAQYQLSVATNIIIRNGLFPIVLGGGHEVAWGNFLAITDFLKSKNKSNLGIINFDAHFDLRPVTDKCSSGTMFSQMADFCMQNNNTFNYMCLGVQKSGNTKNLFNRANELNVDYTLAIDFKQNNFSSIKDKVDNFISDKDYVYVTLCSDVFNAANAPGVSAPQPFGMDPEIVLDFIKYIFTSDKVICFDVAEVSPRFDDDNRTAKLVAIIIYSIINQISN